MTSGISPTPGESGARPAEGKRLGCDSQNQFQLAALIDQFRKQLAHIPDHSDCLNCGSTTGCLFPVMICHEDFHFKAPISICRSCSNRPPFRSRAANKKLWYSLMVSVVVCFVAIQLPYLLLIAPLMGIIVYRIVKPPLRQSISECNRNLRTLVGGQLELKHLLNAFPEATVSIDPEASGIFRTTVPLLVFDQSVVHHKQFMAFSDADDSSRSGTHSAVLSAMITRIDTIIKTLLRDYPPGRDVAVQVAMAILPGRRSSFEVDVVPVAHQRLKNELTKQLRVLPPIPCNYPMLFSIRRCDPEGWRRFQELPAPFLAWWTRVGRPAETSYANLAMQAHDAEIPDPPVSLTVEDCRSWKDLFPQDVDLAILYAELLNSEQRTEEAITIVEEQLRQPQTGPFGRFRCAAFLEGVGRVERSAAICQQLTTRFPDFTEAFGYLAHLQLELGRPQDALSTIRTAPIEHRSSRFWYTSATIAFANQDLSQAYDCANSAIRADAEFAPPYQLRSQLLAHEGRYELSLQALEQYHERAGPSLDSIQLNASLLIRLGRHEQAIAVYSQALEQNPQHPLLQLLRAERLADAGKFELARVDCESVFEKFPDFAGTYQMLARIDIETQEADACEANATMAIEKGLETSQVYMYRGLARIMNDDPDGAEDDLACACKLDPENMVAKFHLSRVKAMRDRIDEATADLADILDRIPSWLEPRMMRGFLNVATRHLDMARVDFDELIRIAPENVDAWRGRALVHEAMNETAQAIELLDKGLMLDPENADCRLVRSRILLATNDLEAAQKDLDAALDSIPNLLPALLSRAHVHLNRGDYDRAQMDFDAILNDHPQFTPALIGRSVAWDQKGESERSIQDLNAALESSPDDTQSIEVSRLMMTAFLAHRNERYEDAIRIATETLELDPTNSDAYRCRAGASWYSEQFVDALQDYCSLIELQETPEAATFNGRGQVYAEMGEYELALRDLQNSVELARESDAEVLPYCLNGLGKALTGLGRFEDAEVAFHESLVLQPGNAWLQFNRGILFMARGEPRNAGICFELALQLTNPPLTPRKKAKVHGFIERMNVATSAEDSHPAE